MSEQIGPYRVQQQGPYSYAYSPLRRCVAWTRPAGDDRTEIRVLTTHNPPEPWLTDRSLPRRIKRTDEPCVQSYVVTSSRVDKLLERILLTASVEVHS